MTQHLIKEVCSLALHTLISLFQEIIFLSQYFQQVYTALIIHYFKTLHCVDHNEIQDLCIIKMGVLHQGEMKLDCQQTNLSFMAKLHYRQLAM